jgi:hypothetical protein
MIVLLAMLAIARRAGTRILRSTAMTDRSAAEKMRRLRARAMAAGEIAVRTVRKITERVRGAARDINAPIPHGTDSRLHSRHSAVYAGQAH